MKLENLNMTFKKNSVTAISGNNSLAKVLSLADTNGYIVKINNEEVIDKSMYTKKIMVVYKDFYEQFLFDTVSKELYFYSKHLSNKKDVDKHVLDSLKMVGLDNTYLNRTIDSLSISEAKKIALASVLSVNPKIIILEDITKYLDNKSVLELVKLIRLLKTKYNKTIILISNDTDFIHLISDYVYIINNDKVILEGDKYTVFKEDLKKYNLKQPKIMYFITKARSKNIRLPYRDEINDLMKDIYRYVN